MLHERSSGVARHSLHMEGRAIDVRLDAAWIARTSPAARWSMKRGGVGYYRQSDFVHLDTGAVPHLARLSGGAAQENAHALELRLEGSCDTRPRAAAGRRGSQTSSAASRP